MIARHMKIQMDNLERKNKEANIINSRRANIDIRKKWMEAKTVKNYQSEYDRIRNHMASSSLPYKTKEAVIQRKAVLERMGAKAVGS
jgi:uncharacterized protein (DUF111 family)